MFNDGFELTPDLELMQEIETLKKRIADLEKENADLKSKIEKPLTWDMPNYYIQDGTRKGSNEIYFESIPGTGVIKQLKESLKMRWNKQKKCWYGFVTVNDIQAVLYDLSAA